MKKLFLMLGLLAMIPMSARAFLGVTNWQPSYHELGGDMETRTTLLTNCPFGVFHPGVFSSI